MAGIYIHIPFCKKRCIYCDFYSTTDNAFIDKYIDTLCNEFTKRINEIDKDNVTTIYIGGGTPSQLSIQQLSRVINYMKAVVDLDKIQEFTIEVNPDDVTLDYMKHCHSLGINRVSMGVQSFVDNELKAINRRHNSAQAREAVSLIKKAGFNNISIDLIYGLPLQNIDSWKFSINEALSLDVPHISCYNLSYEEGTVLYKMREKGEIKECEENECVQMYEILVSTLKKSGYKHYEISNFAKEDKYSKHNSNYWNLTPYLGLGASAHSYDGDVRRYNPSSISDYMKKIKTGIAYEEESETILEKYNEFVMINLRTMWGVNINQVKLMFGNDICELLIKYSHKFISSGDLVRKQDTISLTEKGVLLSDYIIRDLMIIS